jgi:ankyrin repeat protein
MIKMLTGFWMVSLLSAGIAAAAAAGDPRLLDAVKSQDRNAVRALLKERADVNSRQADGATALAWAVHLDDLETAQLLIGAGADVNLANEYGVTPLSLACTNSNVQMLGALLKAGANPNAAVPTGETPLMTCAQRGNVEAVKALLSHGADVNAKETRRDQTALMWAASEEHPDVVKVLVEAGANVNARSKTGFTPLLFAVRQGDIESARLLLAGGADVNDATPPTKSLAAAGMIATRATLDRTTALLVATGSGHEKMALFLLENGANPKVPDGRGVTPLHSAIQRGMVKELVPALLARGVDVNAQIGGNSGDDAGATPFLLATSAMDVPTMRLLVSHGANPLTPTKEGTTPLMVAAGMHWNHIGKSRTPVEERNALEALKLTVELGGNVNDKNIDEQTALHAASYLAGDAIIQYLVEKGGNLNAKDRFGQTPYSIAAYIKPDESLLIGVNPTEYAPMVLHQKTADLIRSLGGTQ